MKYTVSNQMIPFSRDSVELIDYIDLMRELTEDQFSDAVSDLEKRSEGMRKGDSFSFKVEGFDSVTVTVADLNEEEEASIKEKDRQNRRTEIGYTCDEWRCVGGGGSIDSGVAGALGEDVASVFVSNVYDSDDNVVGELKTTGNTNFPVEMALGRWEDENLYEHPEDHLLELVWDDDCPYEAILHSSECLNQMTVKEKKRLKKSSSDDVYIVEIEGEDVEINIIKCDGCEPVDDDVDVF